MFQKVFSLIFEEGGKDYTTNMITMMIPFWTMEGGQELLTLQAASSDSA